MLEKLGLGALAVLAALALGSCSSSGDDDEPAGPRAVGLLRVGQRWLHVRDPRAGLGINGLRGQACGGFNCCLLTENPDESTALRCERSLEVARYF